MTKIQQTRSHQAKTGIGPDPISERSIVTPLKLKAIPGLGYTQKLHWRLNLTVSALPIVGPDPISERSIVSPLKLKAIPGLGYTRKLRWLLTLPSDFGQRNACAEIKIHPAGRYLYVSNRGHDSIARFQVDERSGKLTALGHTPTEKTPRSFDLDPAGKLLYVCGETTDKIVAYRVDQEAGGLTPTAMYSVGKTPWWVSVVDVSR